MRKQTGLDLARHRTRNKLRGFRITGERTGMVNERDAICATESERVIGFNAITLRAAFHRYLYWHEILLKIDNSQVGKGGLPPPQLSISSILNVVEVEAGPAALPNLR